MRVDKARHDDTMACIESRFVGMGGAQFGCSPHSDDPLITNHNRAIFDDTEVAEGMSALRSACEGKELGGGVDEHGGVESSE
jgi:hypothetical protein